MQITFDSITSNNTQNTKATEVHDYCNIVSAILHKGRTGKFSIAYGFVTNNDTSFVAYGSLSSDKTAEFTVKRMIQLLVKSVGAEKAKAIFDKCNDDTVDTYEDLAKELLTKLDKALQNAPVRVYVDRVKEGDYWNVKWYFDKPVPTAAESIQV